MGSIPDSHCRVDAAADFSQADMPSDIQFRIYILSTKTELPIGEITKQPENPRESPVITVTLRK